MAFDLFAVDVLKAFENILPKETPVSVSRIAKAPSAARPKGPRTDDGPDQPVNPRKENRTCAAAET